MATRSKKKSAPKRPVAKKKIAPTKKSMKMKAVAKAKPAGKAKPAAKKTAAKPNQKASRTSDSVAKRPKLSAHEFSAKVLTPLEDRIVVRIAISDEKTAGGLYIPGTVTSQPDRGQVLAKGPGRRDKKGRLRPLDVEVGDTVVFPQYTGTKISISGEDFLIMREDDVLGVVET